MEWNKNGRLTRLKEKPKDENFGILHVYRYGNRAKGNSIRAHSQQRISIFPISGRSMLAERERESRLSQTNYELIALPCCPRYRCWTIRVRPTSFPRRLFHFKPIIRPKIIHSYSAAGISPPHTLRNCMEKWNETSIHIIYMRIRITRNLRSKKSRTKINEIKEQSAKRE